MNKELIREYISANEEDTEAAGRDTAVLASENAPAFVALYGDLGAGKTAFTRGFAEVLSPGSRVKSPSYTLVNEYRRGDIPLFHFDLYRLGEDADTESLGLEEYAENGHCIIEWSEYLDIPLPLGAITVTIEKISDTVRRISVERVVEQQ
jgi:tRNA threonylcarbamoyladenosine biosynthesis protein TsaE